MVLSNQRYVTLLLLLFTVIWTVLAINPLYRDDWLLENALTGITLLCLMITYRRMPLSNASYSLIFVFLSLHTLGSHYTYAEVPYEQWVFRLTGGSLNDLMHWQRNQFDRLVHFLYGLLLVYPIREVVMKLAEVKPRLGYFVAVLIVMSTSMLYEIMEWGAAVYFGGDLGVSYLGIQGDTWDAQKDMLLASIGGVIAALYLCWQPRKGR
ncbi:DUF2238 domain-containing protein [Amphritea opalescens]|uniref:DUF2238 domain-containing protein n=1 Tax=Amphritea opalescens TaxID=2490544 RepID=A0A430KVL8_9GAMM|nr:DUF2238 domain-containing protein [Amphritea opalescens]RTE67530.1 DUF2238 domain-containing protein [Amphritea opalescens]